MARRSHLDNSLGLGEPISRRDFLDGMLMASTVAALGAACPFPMEAQSSAPHPAGWSGCTGEGDYQGWAGNTKEVIHNTHAVRDGSPARCRGNWRSLRLRSDRRRPC
jgi:hypothetical protein